MNGCSWARVGAGCCSRSARRPLTGCSAICREVPIRTFNDWKSPPPDFCEIDMVAHGGTSVAGSFIQTQTMVDVATGCRWWRATRLRGHARTRRTARPSSSRRTARLFAVLWVTVASSAETARIMRGSMRQPGRERRKLTASAAFRSACVSALSSAAEAMELRKAPSLGKRMALPQDARTRPRRYPR